MLKIHYLVCSMCQVCRGSLFQLHISTTYNLLEYLFFCLMGNYNGNLMGYYNKCIPINIPWGTGTGPERWVSRVFGSCSLPVQFGIIMPCLHGIFAEIQLKMHSHMLLVINSFAPGKCGYILQLIISELKPRLDIFNISCEIAFWWMPQDLNDYQSVISQ